MNLYPFQQAGVERLLLGNCILADEMGLGKTVTALTAAIRGGYQSVTVVCPLAVVGVWTEHIVLLGGPEQCTVVPWSRLNQCPLRGSLLIVDEAHYCKNRKAIRTTAIRRLAKRYGTVWMLTGTPYVNHAADYWSLLNITYPQYLRSYWKYVDIWCASEFSPFTAMHKKVLPNAKNPAKFAAMLQNYVLRRTKTEVGLELPAVTESVIHVPMTIQQQSYHAIAIRDILLDMEGRTWFIPNPAVAYTRARQIAIDPRILKSPHSGDKLSVLKYLCEEGERVIVFSEFVTALRLANDEHPGHLYHGGLSEGSRAKVLQAWRIDPEGRPLYMSRAAGGIGLTLTESDMCVFLDEPWTSTDREQAIARLVRIGQTRPVTVYSLRAPDSVEEHVVGLQSGKRDAIEAVCRELLKG